MIIIGFPGIGKSTLAQRDHKYLDLECSTFYIDGRRQDGWHKIYCNIAEHLSDQGYIVLMSAHDIVRDEFRERGVDVFVAYPSLALKDDWNNRLYTRWLESTADEFMKNHKAWMCSAEQYTKNVTRLMQENSKKIEIKSMDYNLEKLIAKANSKSRGRQMKLLLPLFRLTVQHEKLDWLTNIIVKLGGKKNYNKFYELPH